MSPFGKEAFREGLKALDYACTDLPDARLSFPYTINAGRFAGTQVEVGLEIPPDFNVTCPSGPHIRPRLVPINTAAQTNERAAESPAFGTDWLYLSRPFSSDGGAWNRTPRDVRAYLKHVKRILETL